MKSYTTPSSSRTRKTHGAVLALLFFICYPIGLFKIWRSKGRPAWLKWTYSILGLPLFLISYSILGIILFASFLPELDRSIGERSDRTIRNSMDRYSVTFLKTGKETNGAYEEVEVTLDPGGGNDWHYHTAFVEKFHVIAGELTVGMNGEPVKVTGGKDTVATKRMMHKFYNTSSEPVKFIVRIEPALSFEKTLRSAYGLMSSGQSHPDGMPKNPWHLFLILGYSDSYLQGVPGFIQEPLTGALAKIAQWKGYGKDFDVFCR